MSKTLTEEQRKQQTIIAIGKAYDDKNQNTINRIESIMLPNKMKMPEPLEKILKEFGNTPVLESEFYELAKKEGIFEVENFLIDKFEISEDDYSALDIRTFTNRMYEKVNNLIDEDGKYKTTDAIDSVKLPNRKIIKELADLSNENKIENDKILQDIIVDTKLSDKEKEEKYIASLNSANKLFEDKIIEYANIKQATEWEQKLVVNMFTDFVKAVGEDTTSNYSDRTPFARYIKN